VTVAFQCVSRASISVIASARFPNACAVRSEPRNALICAEPNAAAQGNKSGMQPDSGVRTPGQQIGESGDVHGDMDQLSESALMYGSYAVSDSRGAGSGPGLASGFRGDAMSQVQDRASACACEAARWRSEGFFLGRFLIAAGASKPREISGEGALGEPAPWLSDAPRAQHLPAPRPAPAGWDAHVWRRAQ
jgi:hypothetical protein